jgi:drug/metabolite transporter (DMT)-like permease
MTVDKPTAGGVPAAASREKTRGASPMLTNIIIILIPTIAGVIGQLMLKVGMQQMGALQLSADALPALVLRIATSPMIIFGLAIYMGGVFFWLIGLNRMNLSFLYPFASLSYVLIAVASWAILREDVPPMRWVGMVVICVGVAVAARG